MQSTKGSEDRAFGMPGGTDMKKQNTDVAAVAGEVQKTYTEDEILDLFRSADAGAKQAALLVLKCEKPQAGDVMSMLSGIMKGEGSKTKKTIDALTALSVMTKSKDCDFTQLQDLIAAAAGMMDNVCEDDYRK